MQPITYLAPALLLSSVTLANATPVELTNKLTADDGAAFDQFGFSVGISGSMAIVGASRDDDNGGESGTDYLFDTTTGAQTKLTASDGEAGDQFGTSVAISGSTAIVGALGDDDNGGNSGSAYLFNASTGDQIAKLTASDGAAFDKFGYSVGISGSTAIVGARLDDDKGTNSGSAYFYDIADIENPVETNLVANDGAGSDYFGVSVALSGSTAIVGARFDDDKGSFSGSAYFYDIADLQNPVETKLIADDGAADDVFGISVGISGSMAIVGAWLDDDKGTNSGSAYLYTASAPAPVPLPASLWLLGAAVGGAAGLRRVAQRRRT